VPDFRYAQRCPLARAAEIVADRWTLPLVRELLLGPLRFRDLQRRLPGLSTSVLSDRLRHLEAHGLTEREVLPRPASASVYRLTPDGEALREPVLALARWGARFLDRSRPGDHFEPAWIRLALEAAARAEPAPEARYEVRVRGTDPPVAFEVRAGPGGVRVGPRSGPPDWVLSAEAATCFAVLGGALPPAAALEGGGLDVRPGPGGGAGDPLAAARAFFDLFASPVPEAPAREAVPENDHRRSPEAGPSDPGA